MTKQKELKKYRRLFQMYYLKRSGLPDAAIGRTFGITRERVGQIFNDLEKKYPYGLAQIDSFIRAREPIRGELFWNCLKNIHTLKSLIHLLKYVPTKGEN